ncbi:phenazine biosynthesis FMN-dependent oxidase PhzG [Streptomyces sp. NBC_00868]|uniref:phenazine biosynthesis FMN-dependent oxidase PhzG n=1 Tax=unclassified Streptomyces TaxID=2593676 RepID=UPI0032526FBC|nr:phenazine biosynthesis FMN-dependent oxidase PhzG [Streptomyces sp. NBC_00868]
MTTPSDQGAGAAPVREPEEFRKPPADPLALLRTWLDRAKEEVREPGAIALATTGADGRASSRIVQLNSLSDTGLVFTSHRGSPKDRELAVMPWASGVLYWRESRRQIIVAGPVEQLPDSDSDALWAARPVTTHAMSVASRQSEVLADVEALRAHAARLSALGPLPRPEPFVGYQLVPHCLEFWESSPDRLHRRLRYDHQGGSWSVLRLQP